MEELVVQLLLPQVELRHMHIYGTLPVKQTQPLQALLLEAIL
jgi:hypothetical protein